ncbi:radical SAM protein [Bacillus cereus]|nr:radical SAM protein [Bacillus cereus]
MNTMIINKEKKWYEEGMNRIDPDLYKRYMIYLYDLEKNSIENHPFLDELSKSLSFTPFSPEKALFVKGKLELGENVRRLEIDITDVCNFKCPGCTFQFSQMDKQLPFEKLDSFIQELKEAGYTSITLAGGGEPSIYNYNGKRLPDVTERFLENGIDTFVITNAFALGSQDDVRRLLLSTKGIRISYYNFVAPGEPENKNDIVSDNVRLLLRTKELMNIDTEIIVGNLVSWNSKRDYEFTIELAKRYRTIITPRPMISINRDAKKAVKGENLNKVLNRVLENYMGIKEQIDSLYSPVAAREFLERILAFHLPLPKRCIVTELGLVGKMRANGDLYRCGQLSARSGEIEKKYPNVDKTTFYNSIDDSTDYLKSHIDGKKGLVSYNMCPVCRETINNIRFSKFHEIPSELRNPILQEVNQAFSHNKNLAGFW